MSISKAKGLSYIFFKIVAPYNYNYTLLAATVKVFETLLEAILYKPFQLFRRILNYCISITKQRPSILLSVEGTGKNHLEQCQESIGDAPLLSHWSLLRNP